MSQQAILDRENLQLSSGLPPEHLINRYQKLPTVEFASLLAGDKAEDLVALLVAAAVKHDLSWYVGQLFLHQSE